MPPSARRLVLALALLLGACATQPPRPASPQPDSAAPSSPSKPVAPARPASAPPVAPALDAARLPPFDGLSAVLAQPTAVKTIDRTVPPADLWQRIRQGFAMPDVEGPLVREQMAYYAARPDYLQRVFDRSRLYLYHIVDELEKRGMPTELALLPMVESAFNPMAYSRSHASGLWQFIPGTGRRFELQQNWWYDGRRDIVDSTNAALDYLAFLYDMHGDWQLALASYNWGEGAVSRAIAKNRAAGLPGDYAHLSMPIETRHYLPKLQALKNIILNPESLGIVLEPIPNQPYFATYTKLRDIDVQLAAKLAEMPVDEFIALNPGFSRPLIRASMTPRIVLPADRIDVFHENLEKLDEKSLVSWKSYAPRPGENFESIARKHGMTVAQLKVVNGISSRTRAVPRLMVVPVSSHAAAGMEKLPIMYAPPIPVTYRRVFHTVKPGETLASIGRRYGVPLADMEHWNPKGAVVGQKVTLEVRVASKARSHGKPKGQARKTG